MTDYNIKTKSKCHYIDLLLFTTKPSEMKDLPYSNTGVIILVTELSFILVKSIKKYYVYIVTVQ
jgi:hypothetical protein